MSWLSGIVSSIGHEVQSRKFRAALIVLLGVVISALKGELPTDTAGLVAGLIVGCYVLGIALEDGLVSIGGYFNNKR